MATRTIYLSNDQLKIYQKAQTIAGERNMSNYVIKALKHYMGIKPIESIEGYVPYMLFVGETGKMEKIMFKGTFLSSVQTIESNKQVERHLYLTQKQNILLYERSFDEMKNKEKATYQIFNSIEEVIKSKSSSLPQEFLIRAKEKLNIKEAVQLDV